MFESLSLAGFSVAMLAALLLAIELGFRGHGWRKRWLRESEAPHSHDYLLSAVLGLLALLLAFTFALALNRYEARRELVVREANALGTSWLRAQHLDEPLRGQVQGLLRQYLENRLLWSEAAELDNDAAMGSVQAQLWAATGRALQVAPAGNVSRGLMEAVNDSFDAAAARHAIRSAHIPDRVLYVLLLYALLSAGMLGYTAAGNGRHHRIASALVMILLTLAVTVILDLDRPRRGAIMVSQAPLEVLRQDWR